MKRAHEKFLGWRVLITFTFAVSAQMAITLLTIRLGWSAIFVITPLFFAYVFFFGRAFLLALRRLSLLRHTDFAIRHPDLLHDLSSILLVFPWVPTSETR